MMVKENTEGYKETELGLIPEDWDIASLQELLVFKNGLNKGKEFFGKGTPIVNYMDVNKKRGLYSYDIKGLVEVTEKECENFSVHKGDVFFTRTSETIEEIGMSSVILDELKDTVFSGFILRARPKTNRLDPLFCKYCFSSYQIRKEIKSKGSYTTRALTSGTSLNAVNISFPSSLAEQNKIGKIITLVEIEIEAIEINLKELAQLKKALAKKLLSEGIGHAEFKDSEVGRIPVEWTLGTLGEITNKIQDGNYGNDYPKNEEFIDEGIPFLTSRAIGDSKTIIGEFVKYISTEKHEKLKKAHIKVGDLIFTNRGGNSGEAALVPEKYNNANIGPQLTLIRCNEEIVYNKFLFMYIQTSMFSKQLKQFDGGSAMNFFSISTTEKFKVVLPSLEEQIKIATILERTDDAIREYVDQKSDYIQLKDGLMQQLLTGKVRV